jgi:hypothetical protein
MTSSARLFCSNWLPSEWEINPGTQVSGEGWISGEPRRCKVVRLVRREAISTRLRFADQEALLRTEPHLAIALLRQAHMSRLTAQG